MLFGVPIWKLIVDAYFLWILMFFVIRFLLTNKRMLLIGIAVLLVFIFWFVAKLLDLTATLRILDYVVPLVPVLAVVIMAQDIRHALSDVWKADTKREGLLLGSEQTKANIADAVMELSGKRIGALITIEKHNTLEQYSERAITMNANVSKELLTNIFTPLTPLHDGAVIIRGDQIICAGAYFVLSENASFDKTMGSRHRAGLGISEVSDSLTIIVSEETGHISLAIEGILLKINGREKLLEYINTFMK